MEFEGSELIRSQARKVFDFITDPLHFSTGIPDIQSVRVLSADRFSVTAKLGVSVIRSTFTIDFQVSDKVAPSHVRLTGHGISAGSAVDLEITIDLKDESPNTALRWRTVARVSGTLAALGQRVLGAVADGFVKEVFDSIHAMLEAPNA